MSGWTKGEVIALFSVIVAVLSVAAHVSTPELRCSLFKDCSGITGNPPSPVTNNDPTPLSSPEPKTIQPLTNPDIPTTGSEASEVGADYTKLKDLLAAGDFKGADLETGDRMLWVSRRKQADWLRKEDIDEFPCQDLRTIDRLWREYSSGKFGFSVQKQIYIDVGGTLGEDDFDKYERFNKRVGWKVGDNWLSSEDSTFDLRAEKGHLPIRGIYLIDFKRRNITYLLSRTNACNL